MSSLAKNPEERKSASELLEHEFLSDVEGSELRWLNPPWDSTTAQDLEDACVVGRILRNKVESNELDVTDDKLLGIIHNICRSLGISLNEFEQLDFDTN